MFVRDQITQGCYRFIPSNWAKVSEQAKDLVKKLLVVDPKKRLTVEEALQHPWMQASDEQMKATAFEVMYPAGEGPRPSTSRKRPLEDKDEDEQPGKRRPGPPAAEAE
ncbi:hypothetical protein SKAU_G00001910 [Synaphobranchus kaupii]|uniref:Protein kinase domain-containing protein n=1 Tax=Synaphobranchus kaupii TaxID=118154 RepID=A0A9Q1G9C6_SYNKA|nr:hypothetical protein SKAU_G00001910 [Synaphobranchus kaupii]